MFDVMVVRESWKLCSSWLFLDAAADWVDAQPVYGLLEHAETQKEKEKPKPKNINSVSV